MKPETVLSSDMLDILFEHRNKAYGAYILRREYNRRFMIALCSIPVIAGLFFWMIRMNTAIPATLMSPVALPDAVVLRNVQLENPELPKPSAVPKQKQVATIKNTPPVIVPDQVKTDPPPLVDDLLKGDRAISTATHEGEPPGSDVSPVTTEPGGTGTMPASPPEPDIVCILPVADIMPEYPGGTEALRRFLGRNLHVPENAVEPGQQVRVPIRFVVAKTGELSAVEFLVQTDEVFKKEILRVVSRMPKWKPGSQNGKNVAVYFSIPVVFAVQNE